MTTPESKRQQRNQCYQEEMQDIYLNAIKCLRKGRNYRAGNISIHFLSQELGVDERKIHRAIKIAGEKSFTAIVNNMRLDDAKLRLSDPKWSTYTIEEIGLSVGFVSRQSFHLVFHREIGCSPADYRRRHLLKICSPELEELSRSD